MARSIVLPILLACALAACGGASDDPPPPDSGEAGAPACAWAVCSDCGAPHWVWTCGGTPTEPAPVEAAK